MMFCSRKDYLDFYERRLDVEAIKALRKEQSRTLEVNHWQELRSVLEKLPISEDPSLEVRDGVVCIGQQNELSSEEQDLLGKAIELLIPWRKGPFNICGQEIDAEWRSDFKWDRIESHIGDIEGQRVLDVGCNNAYYMFRLAQQNPNFILGLDPSERCFYSFELFQRFAKSERIHFEMFGVEHLYLYPKFFDLILCLGVIYHRSDPIAALKSVRDSLRPGGRALIESQAIEGSGPIAFVPEGRYAKAPNVYFVPTTDCMIAWAKKAGFVDVEVVSEAEITFEEQRQTKLAPYESLQDFLDPDDPRKTVEGHPAPKRVTISVRKKPEVKRGTNAD